MTSPSRDPTEYGLPRPDSKDENARLEIQHQLWKNSLNALFTAPIPRDVKHVLDIGCGPGSWTRDFALAHPNAEVHGLDLNPPATSPAANVTFHSGNAEGVDVLASIKPEAGFDFIFMRCLTLGIHDWGAHVARCFEVLAPGGFLENQEPSLYIVPLDGDTRTNSAMMRWCDRLCDGARALRCDPELARPDAITAELKAAGFEDLSERTGINWPFGGSEAHQWETKREKETAAFALDDLVSFMKAVTERILPAAEGYSLDEARELCSHALEEVQGPKARRFNFELAARFARKPTA